MSKTLSVEQFCATFGVSIAATLALGEVAPRADTTWDAEVWPDGLFVVNVYSDGDIASPLLRAGFDRITHNESAYAHHFVWSDYPDNESTGTDYARTG